MNVELNPFLVSETIGHIMPSRTVKDLSFATSEESRENSWNSGYGLSDPVGGF